MENYNYVIKIGETLSSFFSSLATAIASFTTVACLIALIDSDGAIVIQGNEVRISLGFLILVISLSVLFLVLSCLVLYFLKEVIHD